MPLVLCYTLLTLSALVSWPHNVSEHALDVVGSACRRGEETQAGVNSTAAPIVQIQFLIAVRQSLILV